MLGASVVNGKTSCDFVKIIKSWANIPGTTQHSVLAKTATKRLTSRAIICYIEGSALCAALFVSGNFACIKNKTEKLDLAMPLSELYRKLNEIESPIKPFLTISAPGKSQIQIDRQSLEKALKKFQTN